MKEAFGGRARRAGSNGLCVMVGCCSPSRCHTAGARPARGACRLAVPAGQPLLRARCALGEAGLGTGGLKETLLTRWHLNYVLV